MRRCTIEGCNKKHTANGLCISHYIRVRRTGNTGEEPINPLHMVGDNNPRWNGGNSEYKNHSLLKKVRKQRLKEENYECQICNGPAKYTHHIDKTKENHNSENLLVLCAKCHFKYYHIRRKRIKLSETVFW